MYIAVNKIPGEAKAMAVAFKRALPDMKRFSGFLGLEIWEATDGSLEAVSRWTSKEALAEYTNDQAFKQHHGGPGSGQAHPSAQPTFYSAEVISE